MQEEEKPDMKKIMGSLWGNLVKQAQQVGLATEKFADLNKIKLYGDLPKFYDTWVRTLDIPVLGNLVFTHYIGFSEGMLVFRVMARCHSDCQSPYCEHDIGNLVIAELSAEPVYP